MSKFPENTSGWRTMVADLEAKLQSASERIGAIDGRRKAIALDVAMGNVTAHEESLKLLEEKTRLAEQNCVTVDALLSARACLQSSEHEDALQAERDRLERLDRALSAHRAAAQAVDGKLAELMNAVTGWFGTVEKVREIDPEFRIHAGSLHRAVWKALADSGLTRERGVALRVLDAAFDGPNRPSPAHWAPLADANHADGGLEP